MRLIVIFSGEGCPPTLSHPAKPKSSAYTTEVLVDGGELDPNHDWEKTNLNESANTLNTFSIHLKKPLLMYFLKIHGFWTAISWLENFLPVV